MHNIPAHNYNIETDMEGYIMNDITSNIQEEMYLNQQDYHY
jgi:hypothetical protein